MFFKKGMICLGVALLSVVGGSAFEENVYASAGNDMQELSLGNVSAQYGRFNFRHFRQSCWLSSALQMLRSSVRIRELARQNQNQQPVYAALARAFDQPSNLSVQDANIIINAARTSPHRLYDGGFADSFLMSLIGDNALLNALCNTDARNNEKEVLIRSGKKYSRERIAGYELKSVVKSVANGVHWIAYSKQDDDSWILFDDSNFKVRRPCVERVNFPSPEMSVFYGRGGVRDYICLYEKVDAFRGQGRTLQSQSLVSVPNDQVGETVSAAISGSETIENVIGRFGAGEESVTVPVGIAIKVRLAAKEHGYDGGTYSRTPSGDVVRFQKKSIG